MNELEKQGQKDPILVAEKYWYLSRIQRTVRKFLRNGGNYNEISENNLPTIVQRIRAEKPMLWHVLTADAQILMRIDIGNKAKEIVQEDPSFLEKSPEERAEIAREALIKEYWEVSKKLPRELKMLEGIFADE